MMKTNKGKDALLSLWEIVGMSYQFARLHPNSSGTAAFFFSLYLVCPFGFKFLTYTFATIYGAAIIIKLIANSAPYDLYEATRHSSNDRKFPRLQSDSDEQRPKKPTICSQMSKGRNFKIRREDLETLDDAATKQAPSLCFDDNRIDGLVNDPDNLEDRIAKIDQRDDGMSTIAHRGARKCEVATLNEDESICDFADEPKQSQSEANYSSEELEDGDEEDAPGDRNQAVEWTEDDQQSLMNLGLSELERNKRLENLIATRRVKKAMSMKIQENLVDLDISHPGSIPPVNISRNPFLPPLSGDALESQLPGSAPSVLLPERNLFDLPHDSNEEKPNLTLDGIGAEIRAHHRNDILSRHESFFYGPSFPPGIDEDSGPVNSSQILLSEKRNVREPRYSRFRLLSDKDQHDGLDEQLLSEAEGPKSRPDVHKSDETTNSIHDNLKASSDEQVNEQYREDASTGDEALKESTSSTSEDQKDADATSTCDETLDRQTGFILEGRDGEEFSKGNDNNSNSRNNPFGSFISLTELDKGDSQLQQQGLLAGSPKSSSDTNLEVGNAKIDYPSNGNQSSLENHRIPATSHQACCKQDEEVNKEGP